MQPDQACGALLSLSQPRVFKRSIDSGNIEVDLISNKVARVGIRKQRIVRDDIIKTQALALEVQVVLVIFVVGAKSVSEPSLRD